MWWWIFQGIQCYSQEATSYKATVVYDGEHDLEEETNDQGDVHEWISNTNWC